MQYNRFFFLFCLHFFAHYFPFERKSLGPDTYSTIVSFNHSNFNSFIDFFISYPHRPLNHITIYIQNFFVNQNHFIALFFLFVSSLILVLIIYFILSKLINKNIAFILVVIFELYPSKIETYTNYVFANINFNIFIYFLSFLFFILYIKNNKNFYIFISLIFYTLAIFWYELGFFMPFIFLSYLYFIKNYKVKKIIYLTCPFFFISIFYLSYRFTGAFYISEISSAHTISLNFFGGIIELFHNFFGRYVIRIIIYGIYNFFNISFFHLILILIFDTLLIYYLNKILRKIEIKSLEKKYYYFFSTIFLFSLIPNILLGSAGGRHTLISLFGIIILFYFFLLYFKSFWKFFFIFIFFIGLIISQGNAWTHVVAGRISESIYQTMKNSFNKIDKSEYILINLKSFDENIPHTFFDRDYNIFNTYYGAQMIEPWGLKSMIQLIKSSKNSKKIHKIYIADDIININDNFLEVLVSINLDHKKLKKYSIKVPKNKTFIIDYNLVYSQSFIFGNN